MRILLVIPFLKSRANYPGLTRRSYQTIDGTNHARDAKSEERRIIAHSLHGQQPPQPT